jgi:chromate transporter
MSVLIELFITFFTIGLFSIGGGYAMLPLISQQVGTVHGWMTAQEVTDIVAISQITPGPIAVNAATFAGMKTAGFAGACMATLGVVTPSIIICVLLARFFMDFLKKKPVQGVLYGVRPVVVGLIAYAAWKAALDALYVAGTGSVLTIIDWPMILLSIILLILMKKTKIDPILMIVGSAIVGILLHAIGI